MDKNDPIPKYFKRVSKKVAVISSLRTTNTTIGSQPILPRQFFDYWIISPVIVKFVETMVDSNT